MAEKLVSNVTEVATAAATDNVVLSSAEGVTEKITVENLAKSLDLSKIPTTSLSAVSDDAYILTSDASGNISKIPKADLASVVGGLCYNSVAIHRPNGASAFVAVKLDDNISQAFIDVVVAHDVNKAKACMFVLSRYQDKYVCQMVSMGGETTAVCSYALDNGILYIQVKATWNATILMASTYSPAVSLQLYTQSLDESIATTSF